MIGVLNEIRKELKKANELKALEITISLGNVNVNEIHQKLKEIEV